MDDLISRQAAIETVHKAQSIGQAHRMLVQLPSTQPGQRNARVFQGIIVEYPSISAYPEYEGKPYFSIKYTENGQGFIGYGTYKPEVLSEYLKEYFMPLAQPGWIPCSERLPEEPFACLVTVWDTNPVTMDEFENVLPYFVGWDGEQWNDANGEQCPFEVIAWQPQPTPYREGGQE